MPRNRQLTQQKIQDAALSLLQNEGFENWGVNRIARDAGVDKVLLYRYFGSLDGLLSKIIEDIRFWPDPDDLPDNSAEAFISATLDFQLNSAGEFSLLAHPMAREARSGIRRRFSAQLDRWLSGFRNRTRGYIQADQLERLPAFIHFQSSTGRTSFSARDIWRQLSPPLEWARFDEPEDDNELPIELL